VQRIFASNVQVLFSPIGFIQMFKPMSQITGTLASPSKQMFAYQVNLSKIGTHGSSMEPRLENLASDAAV